jgi:hypothetical protein
MKLLVTQFLQPPVASSLFGSNILLRILFSNFLSLCCSQVSHPYTAIGKIVFLYIENNRTTKQFRFDLVQFREGVHEFHAILVYLARIYETRTSLTHSVWKI